MPAGHVLFAGLLGLGLALILNSGVILHEAETKPSATPKVPAAVFRPIEAVASFLRLDVPRDLADQALGRERFETVFELPPATNEDVAAAEESENESAAPGEVADAPITTAAPTTTTATEPPRIVASAEDRATVWIGGDSMGQVVGDALVRRLTETGVIHAVLDSRPSTGLTRPDFFDWPRRLNEVATGAAVPDVFIVVMGANDAQGITLPDGTIFQFGEDGWAPEYRRRVNGVMQFLTQDPARRVIWLGQPAARDSSYSERMADLNEIYRSEAEAFPAVAFIDVRSIMSNGTGNYEGFLTPPGGETFAARQSDGFHLSLPGGEWLADAVMVAIEEQIDFQIAPPTTAPTTVVDSTATTAAPTG